MKLDFLNPLRNLLGKLTKPINTETGIAEVEKPKSKPKQKPQPRIVRNRTQAQAALMKRESRHAVLQSVKRNTNGLPLGVTKSQAADAIYYRKHKAKLAELPAYLRDPIENTIKRLRECHRARQAMRRGALSA